MSVDKDLKQAREKALKIVVSVFGRELYEGEIDAARLSYALGRIDLYNELEKAGVIK